MRRHRGRGRFVALYGQALGGAEAEAPWWLAGGIAAANCIAAYQPIGAADIATSYVNLANPGTYDATEGVAPVWNAATGWTFDGGTKFLNTGINPVTSGQAWSFALSYLIPPAPPNIGYGHTGSGGRGTGGLWLCPYYYDGRYSAAANGSYATFGAGSSHTSGVSIVAGNKSYYNASQDGTTIGTSATDFGAFFIGKNADSWFSGTIYSLAVYDTVLSSDQITALTTAMAALSGPLALPIELVSQPESEPIPIVNLFGWRVPLCSKWTWEHIIKKVWK